MVDQAQLIDEKSAVSLLNDLEALSQSARKVKERILKVFPAKYGSDLWWEKSDREAVKQLKEGKGVTIKNNKELKKFLRI